MRELRSVVVVVDGWIDILLIGMFCVKKVPPKVEEKFCKTFSEASNDKRIRVLGIK